MVARRPAAGAACRGVLPLEREHKSNKRRAIHCSPRGGLAGPLSYGDFTVKIALPRGLKPHPQRLARYAPVAWSELGPNFATAFLGRHERRQMPRQFGIRSDISVHPDRDANDPVNDPCVHCRVNSEYVHCLDCAAADESKVLKMMLCRLC